MTFEACVCVCIYIYIYTYFYCLLTKNDWIFWDVKAAFLPFDHKMSLMCTVF